MGTLNDDKEGDDKKDNKKEEMDENVAVVCGEGFICWQRGEGLDGPKKAGLWIFCRCGRLIEREGGLFLDGVCGRQSLILY